MWLLIKQILDFWNNQRKEKRFYIFNEDVSIISGLEWIPFVEFSWVEIQFHMIGKGEIV